MGRSRVANMTRLSVNINEETAQVFRDAAEKRGVTITEVIRRAAAYTNFLELADSRGDKILVVQPDGTTVEVKFL